ncbi:single-stranded DNA-binding protein [miscellaneous Crenarchaeota group archaeon SMTZ-80]|nr:MAG: single-stranded DNA-binding protein [miscellaneous Crenarchaeota group archaeon SMTZ-80]
MSKGTVNKVILIGRLGKDPDMRYTPSGIAVANFSLATNHAVKDQDGNFNDKTEWHRVVAYGRTAEVAGEYLQKGKLVYVEGRIQSRSWEDQNGQKRYVTEIVCSNMQLLGSRAEAESKIEGEAEQEEVKAPDTEINQNEEGENDLPF